MDAASGSIQPHAGDQLSEQQALEYVADLTRRGRSGSTINQALGAIKFFYTEVVAREWALSTRFQRFPQRLPVVLSREEMRRLLEAAGGMRERAAMEIGYAAGLRLNELLQLRVSDIDSERMVIHVRQGKRKKDREVMLAASLLETLVVSGPSVFLPHRARPRDGPVHGDQDRQDY